MEDMPCELSILLPFIVPPSASTGCFRCSDGFDAAPGYPPYNIERTGENDYRITVAVAGFGENELSIEAKENTLTIKGEKQAKEETERRGALTRASRRARSSAVFQLADHVQVKSASARERSPARRSRARNPRGKEAAPDSDRQRPGQSPPVETKAAA